MGLLTGILYRNNISPVIDDIRSINLGAVYESVVAQELRAHGYTLFYYDNRKVGEVDFLIDDYDAMSVRPIEVKSGKDYTIHSALNNFLATPDYHIIEGIVFSNERICYQKDKVLYMPIYFVMCINSDNIQQNPNDYIF